jgi:hypothetical protein
MQGFIADGCKFRRKELGGGVPGPELIGSKQACDFAVIGQLGKGQSVIVEAKGRPTPRRGAGGLLCLKGPDRL